MKSADQIERDVYDLFGGSVDSIGTVTLATSPATTTTVTRRGVSSNSIVFLKATNAAAKTEGSDLLITPTKGQFIIAHTSSAGTRTYRYIYFTPRRPL